MNSKSLARLKECHPDIVKLAMSVDAVYPIQCTCGARNKEAQDKAFIDGFSDVQYPNSKHNIGKEAKRELSDAGDFVPDPDRNPKTISWADLKEFEIMCLTFESMAETLGIKIKLGRDFKNKKGKPMGDWPHIELAD